MNPSVTIDLRSDTVTRPTAAMREAMARAEVGDDVLGDDPTVARLEQTIAELLGKEAAVFVPSGTMGNQIALLAHCERGDEVIVGVGAHLAWYETGAGAALAGVQFLSVGSDGTFTADDVLAAIKPAREYHPRTRLVAIENTHNRGGGRVFPQRDVLAVAEVAERHGLALHLDEHRRRIVADEPGESQLGRHPVNERAEPHPLNDPGHGQPASLRHTGLHRHAGLHRHTGAARCRGCRRRHVRRQIITRLLPESATANRSPCSQIP